MHLKTQSNKIMHTKGNDTVEFKTEDTKTLIYIYKIMPIVFIVIWTFFLFIDIKENGMLTAKEWLTILSIALLFIVILLPSFKSALYTVTFIGEGFKYKNMFSKGFVTYDDIRELIYVETKGRGSYLYTVEIIRNTGRPLRFSISHLKLGTENDFKKEWEKRANKEFFTRKGYILF